MVFLFGVAIGMSVVLLTDKNTKTWENQNTQKKCECCWAGNSVGVQ